MYACRGHCTRFVTPRSTVYAGVHLRNVGYRCVHVRTWVNAALREGRRTECLKNEGKRLTTLFNSLPSGETTQYLWLVSAPAYWWQWVCECFHVTVEVSEFPVAGSASTLVYVLHACIAVINGYPCVRIRQRTHDISVLTCVYQCICAYPCGRVASHNLAMYACTRQGQDTNIHEETGKSHYGHLLVRGGRATR